MGHQQAIDQFSIAYDQAGLKTSTKKTEDVSLETQGTVYRK